MQTLIKTPRFQLLAVLLLSLGSLATGFVCFFFVAGVTHEPSHTDILISALPGALGLFSFVACSWPLLAMLRKRQISQKTATMLKVLLGLNLAWMTVVVVFFAFAFVWLFGMMGS